MPLTRITAFFLLLLLQVGAVAAQSCVFTNTGIDFGNVNLNSGGFQSANGAFTANCTGTPGQSIRICPNFNVGSGGMASGGDPRYLVQGANRMNYNLFRSNGVGQIWGSYTWSASPRPPAMTVSLNGSGSGSASQTIFGRLYNSQGGVTTGTFQSVFSGTHTQIDYGYAPAFTCGPTLSPRVQSVPFIVRTTNNSSCTVATTAMNFGNQANLSTVKTATNTVSVACTGGTLFNVGLDNGTSGATSPTARRMTNTAAAEQVTYGIYRNNAYSLPWGNTPGIDTVSGTGTGAAQSFTGFGRIPVQTTPPSLTYTDTVVVTVTY